MKRYTTIMLSIETYDDLHRLKKELEKIFGHSVSFDKLIKFLLKTKVDWSEFIP